MAIEGINLDHGLQNSNNIISPITPKNVLPSSPTKTSNIEFPRPTSSKKSESDEVNDLFNYQNNENCLPKGKNFIDHIFENFGDHEAEFIKKNTAYDKFVAQQEYLTEYSTPVQRKIDTIEAKSGRLLAASEGRKLFCEILENVGINSSEHMADVFSSRKKIKLKFQCSTPIASRTPTSQRINTPLPLSGVRFLGSPLNYCGNDDPSSYMTPASKSNVVSLINVSQASEDIKNILLGITCFLDVRTDKENRNDVCKEELLKIGAKVEKNFTKKVTHVIFKEGRRSTYNKAKALGIPIVSVVWIEACKIARGPVDPSLYPPSQLEKYETENETPFSVIMKRRIKRLMNRKKNGRVLKGGSLRISPPDCNSNNRNAFTELKDNKPSIKDSNKDRLCTKKLHFIDLDEPKTSNGDNDLMALDNSLINDTENLSDSSVFAKLKLNSVPKRKSAPGALAKKKFKNIKNLNDYFTKDNYQNENNKRLRSNSPDSDKKVMEKNQSPKKEETNSKIQNNNANFVPTTLNKKRKLFHPNVSPILNETVPLTVKHPHDSVVNRKTRTLKNCKKGLINSKKLDPLNDTNKSGADIAHNKLSNPRTSLSFFVENAEKTTDSKPKSIPTIVFTSIQRNESAKLALMVKKLGIFEIEDHVSERTSHVVTNSLRRTLNLLKGIARGCWIVRDQWIYESDLSGQWLAEEHFELKSYSPAVTECRLQKRVFKKSFCMDLFSSFGPIYVSSNTLPPTQELIDLIKLCGGKIASCARGAKLIIANKSVSDRSIVRVYEKWILDSIVNNKPLDIDNYLVKKEQLNKESSK